MNTRTALLVIDVQQGLFGTEPPPAEGAQVIARINRLANAARGAGLPVVFVQHESAALPPGSAAWQLADGLAEAEGDLRVTKRTPDGFLRTELAGVLDARDVKHLVVCGYASECCVDSTVRSAAARGFDVTLAADAHTTHDLPHADGLQVRRHENAVLPTLTSFDGRIRAVPAAEISFG